MSRPAPSGGRKLRPVENSEAPVVIKLGGSVIRSSELTAWLDVIASAEEPIIVVPGGGALADEVRACQQSLGFGDRSAHRMALLAMDQLAWGVAGIRSGFEVADTEEALRGVLAAGRIAVWAPYALVADRADVPAAWTVTSDSLALWLTSRVGAARCYIVKSILRKQRSFGAEDLSRQGIVDESFPAMLRQSHVHAYLLGRGDQAALAGALQGNGDGGATIN